MIAHLLRAQIEDVWGRGRIALVDTIYAPDCVDHMPIPGQRAGLEPMKQVVRDFRTAMPDLTMTLTGVIEGGYVGVDWWTLTGTHTGPLFGIAPTGRRIAMSGIDMVRAAGGRVTDLWHVEEMLGFWQQLGVDPPQVPPAVRPVDAINVPQGDPGRGANVAWGPAPTATERRNLAVARRHIELMWAQGRAGLATELYAPGVVDHNPAPGQRAGIAGITDLIGAMTAAVPDLAMQVHQYVVAGDRVADRWTMTGTHTGGPMMGLPAKGRRFTIAGMDVVRIDASGRITDVWHVEEFDRMRAAIAA